VLALGLILAGELLGCGRPDSEQPNLVLITVDRLAADRLACFGGEADEGSSICELGKGGTLFAWTAALGRGEASGAASVLTGLRESGHGVGADGTTFLADARETLAEDLSRAGYATAAFVSRPRVNRSRRLDQGFDLYDDHSTNAATRERPASIDLADRVQDWTENAEAPWFVWIHADRDDGVAELDRLISRLSQTLDEKSGGPGILFAALTGEPSGNASAESAPPAAPARIEWPTHRVPMLWRPPTRDAAPPIAVSFELVSLLDVLPTFRSAAGLPARFGPPDFEPEGRDLGVVTHLGEPGQAELEDRIVLLEAVDSSPGHDVGLATKTHVYARRTSPIDGSGRPVPTDQLLALAARFNTIPTLDPAQSRNLRSASLAPGPWRSDVLSSESPVPRLEFHLARLLAVATEKEPE
jgi:arylsulfatase A-like enzyme